MKHLYGLCLGSIWGSVRSPFLRRSTPIDAFLRLKSYLTYCGYHIKRTVIFIFFLPLFLFPTEKFSIFFKKFSVEKRDGSIFDVSVVGEDQCGDDGIVVAHFDRNDMGINGAPCPYGAGKDVINLLFWIVDAEGKVGPSAVKPLAREHLDYRIVGRGIEVTGQDDGVRRIGKMVKDELCLDRAADTVEGLEMRTGKHDGVAIRKDKSALKQAALFLADNRMRQLDVAHIDKLMPREQSDAVLASAKLDSRSKQA